MVMEFKWLNESSIEITNGKIVIDAPAQTDFFRGSIDECEEGFLPEVKCNAPFYYTEGIVYPLGSQLSKAEKYLICLLKNLPPLRDLDL